MITITIDNPVVEQIYKEKYNQDSEKFSQYISEICIANEVDFNEDLSYLQEELNSKEANEGYMPIFKPSTPFLRYSIGLPEKNAI